jgi:methionine-rich copper-binding protein CopC
MKKLNALGLALVLAGSALFSQVAAAHASLKSAIPAPGATVEAAPKEISLTFDDKLEEAFSAVTIKDAAGKDLATAKAKVDAADGKTLRLAVPTLASGAYSVQWVAVGHDGHRRTGDFRFTVK